nr:dnaJ homolog subfamily C member 7 homolog [Aegilops tauschii subsp. strangulata]
MAEKEKHKEEKWEKRCAFEERKIALEEQKRKDERTAEDDLLMMMNPEGMDAMTREFWELKRMEIMCQRKMELQNIMAGGGVGFGGCFTFGNVGGGGFGMGGGGFDNGGGGGFGVGGRFDIGGGVCFGNGGGGGFRGGVGFDIGDGGGEVFGNGDGGGVGASANHVDGAGHPHSPD